MKEIEENVDDIVVSKDKVIDFTLTQVKPLDFFALNSKQFKEPMKLAGVNNVESADAMRSLFVTWLIGVKGFTSSDVINATKLNKEDKTKLGTQFIQYFKDRPIFGNSASADKVEANLRDYAKMIYESRKQLLMKENLRYPKPIEQRNEVTYENLRKDVFGFNAELEYGMDGVMNNWTSSNNNKTDLNPNGINFNNAFLQGYCTRMKDKEKLETGITNFYSDQNKMKIVKCMGKITKLVGDKNVSEEKKKHLLYVGKRLPGSELKFNGKADAKSNSFNLKFTIEETANNYGFSTGDILETIIDSEPSKDGASDIERSDNGAKKAIADYNKAQQDIVNNALNIVAHNDNTEVMNLAINKGDRFKKGLDLADATKDEIKEAAELFDKIYSPVYQANIKLKASTGKNVIDNITINGEKVVDAANKACDGKDYMYSEKIMYAKAMALRAFVNPELHLFYQNAIGSVNPDLELYSVGRGAKLVEMKDSVAMKPEDFKVGLKYDVEDPKEKITKDTKIKATKSANAVLPKPNYGTDGVVDIKDVIATVPKQSARPVERPDKVKNPVVKEPAVKNPAFKAPVNVGGMKEIDDSFDANEIDEAIPANLDNDEVRRAREFVEGAFLYQECIDNILDWATALKGMLTMNQKDAEANFFSKSNKVEGDKDYQNFTKVIENTITLFKSGSRSSMDQAKQLGKLIKVADDYLDGEFLYDDRMKGVSFEAAREVLNKGDKLLNMLYTSRVAVSGLTKESLIGGVQPYGNLGYNDVIKKAKELKAQYKDTESFKRGFKKPDFNEMYEKSEKQLEIKRKLEKVSKTMSRNFEYSMRTVPDKYLGMSRKRSASAIARWVVTKNYLEQVYKPGATMEEIDALSDVNVKALKKKVKDLANDPVFKRVVKKFPENAFSVWQALEPHAAQMRKDPKNIDKMLNDMKANAENKKTKNNNVERNNSLPKI
ncbi:MAG: hypothetical protein IKQ71_06820 [Lachnospiraceae bacterium]|nr:hypothetical protein [Lachnospiraceae bacterium]